MAILKIKDNNGVWHLIKALKGKDGVNLEFEWNGTKLGIKTSEDKEFKYVDLKGETGQTGATGMTGNSIKSIEKLSTKDNVDTYAVNFTDGTQTTFNVRNGEVSLDELKEVDSKVESNYEEFENLKSELLTTNEVRDSFINVEDSYKERLLNLSIDGVLKQNTTQGNNLLNINNLENKTINGVSLTKNDDGTITLNGTATADANFRFSTNDVEATTNYAIQLYKFKGSFTNNYVSIYLSEDSQFSTFHLLSLTSQDFVLSNLENKTYKYVQIKVSSGVICNNLTIGCQIVKDKDIKTFEKFTGGEPSPSPNYPQEIETITGNFSLTSCNKNIFDFEKLKKDNSLSEISGNFVDFTIKTKGATCLLKFPILIDNLYINFKISSNKMNGSIKVVYEDDTLDAIYEKYDNSVISDVNVSKLFNKNKKIKGIRILTFGEITYLQIKEMLLAISSKKELFVEHLESIVNINLPSDEFIGKLNETYKDELVAVYNQEEGKYHLMLNKMIGKKVVDGKTGSIAKIGDNCFGINDAIKNFLHFSDFTIDNNKNNKYVILAQTSSNSQFFSISKDYNYAMNFTSTEKFNNIRIKDIRLNTVDELKQSLNEKSMEVYYILNLNSRYSLDLGSIDMLKTYEGVTNIFTDSDLLPSIQIKYYKNFKETIKELKINEKSLKDELQSLNERLSALETKQVVSSDDSNVEDEVIS